MKNNDLKSMRYAQSGTVGYTTVANAMPSSREEAPYLGQTHVNGSCSQDDVAQRIASAKGCPIGVEEVKRIWNATGNYVLDRLPEDLCSYDLGFVRIRPAIGGAFPSVDAAFDSERNRVYVAASPSDAIKSAVADVSPSREDGGGDEPEIGNVTWDDVTSRTIKSGEPFKIYGNGLTLISGDESAELQLPDRMGSVDVTVTEVADGNWQRLVGRLSAPVAPCEGAVLVLRTHGYDPESALKVVTSKPLTVLAGGTPPEPAPTITEATSEGSDPGHVNVDGHAVYVKGTNLENGGTVKVYDTSSEEPLVEAEGTWNAEQNALEAFLETENLPQSPDGRLTVTTAGGTAEIEVDFGS